MSQFRGGMNELMRQAARMQRKIDATKQELSTREVTSTSLGDKVKATVTYGRRVVKIELDPELIGQEGIDTALDGVCAAVNAAMELADKAMEAELEKVTGGVKVPGVL
ncbi:MAG: YbaB/EbfC family nucleoid-associated protein [Myxococcales bacterium]|nr:YbaB/EbfC family nucleoid-associated protein [Myxococcales bacterium]